MWIPASENEILAAIDAGDLIETASLDAKAALPAKGKSKDLAIDVAAMANDGGTLLYGVGEDEDRRPTVAQPFKLAGARERVDQIVRTSISEPPEIQVREVPSTDDSSLGYLAVAVPPSPRAPHMVTVGKEYRYYGRGATGNVPLTEGEVARLYERRQRWEVDRDAMLNEAIDSAPIEPHEDFAYLHLVARLVGPDEDLFDKARGDQQAMQYLSNLISSALSAEVYPTSYSPDLHGGYDYERRADGWAVSRGLGTEWEERKDPSVVLDLEIGLDGSGRLFCGRAAEEYNGRLLIFENVVAGLTARFLAVLGGLYAAGGYLGSVDVGLAVTGLRGGISYVMSRGLGIDPTPYGKDRYRRTERVSAPSLADDPRGAASKLVLPLARAITRESYDPFSEKTV
jgi:Putative DNA-binding domain